METTVYIGVIWGLWKTKKETTIVYWDNMWIVDKKMETTIVHWGILG